MREQGDGGSIVNITSIDAVHPSGSGLSHYGTSKHAIWGLTKTMALELGPDGIRVNAVAPGPSLDRGRGRVRRGGRARGHRRRRAVGRLRGAHPAAAPGAPRRRRPRGGLPRVRPRLVRERRAARRRRRAARGMTPSTRALPRVHPRAADGRQPARVAARLDAADDGALAMFYEIPDGVEVPEHAHGAQWGVVLEGSVEFTIDGETRTYRRGDTYFVPDQAPHSAVISPATSASTSSPTPTATGPRAARRARRRRRAACCPSSAAPGRSRRRGRRARRRRARRRARVGGSARARRARTRTT